MISYQTHPPSTDRTQESAVKTEYPVPQRGDPTLTLKGYFVQPVERPRSDNAEYQPSTRLQTWSTRYLAVPVRHEVEDP